MLVAKATGPAYNMIVGLDNAPRSRGIRAWHKLMREAKGTHTVQVHEVTEHLHATDRKQIRAKDVVAKIEEYDNEVRKFTEVTGLPVNDASEVLHLKQYLPDKIRERLQTADLTTYQACKDYASKQARVIKNDKAATEPAPALDAMTKDSAGGNGKESAPATTPQTEEEQWMMFMKG